MDISLQTTTVGEIPILTLAPANVQSAPLVFYIPGYSASKETGLSLGYQIAGAGCFFVAFDPWLHGERFDPLLFEAAKPEQGGIYPPETGMDTIVLFFQVIRRCLEDIRTLLAHLDGDPRVDAGRCGVTGVSMGGYTSFLAFADIPKVQAAVPVVGLPSFSRRWLDLLDECAYSNPEWAAALEQVAEQTAARTEQIQALDPTDRLAMAAPRALLMMSGDFDNDQPKLYSIYAYRELHRAWAAQPDNLRLNVYPVGHTMTPQMERDAVEWFRRHLLLAGR